MPWAQTSPMDERVRFIADHRSGLYTMAELCDRFGISRKTGCADAPEHSQHSRRVEGPAP